MEVYEDPFDQLKTSWTILGLTDEEVQHEMTMYYQRIEEVKTQFYLAQKKKFEDYKQSLQQQKTSLIEILQAVQIPETEINEIQKIDQNCTLKDMAQKLSDYQEKYEDVITKTKLDFSRRK